MVSTRKLSNQIIYYLYFYVLCISSFKLLTFVTFIYIYIYIYTYIIIIIIIIITIIIIIIIISIQYILVILCQKYFSYFIYHLNYLYIIYFFQLLLFVFSLCDTYPSNYTIRIVAFHCQFQLEFFSICIIVPAIFCNYYFLISLSPLAQLFLTCAFIPFSRVSVTY